jgi:glycosyltransferase involved in cell wall biosynthesis
MISNNMNKSPSISVIMSVYNGERYLKEAIESILNQTFTDFEFIIVNDKSTDNSAKIISGFNDPRIVVIENSENIGLTKSLNKALKVARGEYIARMDCDDISLPKRFEIQKKFMDENMNIVLLGGKTIIINNEGTETGKKDVIQNPLELKFRLLISNQISHSTVMFRTAIVIELGGYNEEYRYVQDYELWSRLNKLGYLISNIDEALLKYRFHAESITQNLNSKNNSYDLSKKVIYNNISRYVKLSEEEYDIFLKSFHGHKVYSIKNLFLIREVYKSLVKSYIEIEKPEQREFKCINKYINWEVRRSIKWYIRTKIRS